MRDKQCDVIRLELEELALNREFSAAAAEHMRGCAECREFQRQQMKLRQIVGSLGTVNAPADFDFRLRARLAADSYRSSFRYWSFAVRGLATVAVLVVFGVGAVIVWQRTQQVEPPVNITQNETRPPESRPLDQPKSGADNSGLLAGHQPGLQNGNQFVADNSNQQRKNSRPSGNKSRPPVASFAISSERANVLNLKQPVLDTAPVFPIDASLQSVKVSVDDGRGNARTISFPTVTFGSQRVPASANQIASKGEW